MYKKHSVWVDRRKSAVAMSATLLLCGPAVAMAGTFTGGATFPEQIVQEVTSLQKYAQEVTGVEAQVQTQMNTLQSYAAQMQNLMTLPAQAISQVTMPVQQMEYNYNSAMGLMSEYQNLYGNLHNIQQTVAQQNGYILNSSLSPQDYLNTVESAQTNTAAITRAQIQSTANSMQAADALIPQIAAQTTALQQHGYTGNTADMMHLGSELNTIEQQNQLMLAAINQSKLAAENRRNLREAETAATESATNPAAMLATSQNAVAKTASAMNGTAADSAAAASNITGFLSCIKNGGTYATCNGGQGMQP